MKIKKNGIAIDFETYFQISGAILTDQRYF